MTDVTLVLAALAPLLVVAVLLVGLLWPAVRSMPVAWATAAVVAGVFWGMPLDWIAATTLWGVMLAIEILWIVFGALVLLYTLMRAGAIDRINEGFAAISEDRRVQIVLLGFFMATFLEGVAGFGTPAAVVAPLLLALGFPAMAAVIAALIGHAIATTFGAVGVPVRPGTLDPISALSGVSPAEAADIVAQAAGSAAVYQSLIGVFMPLMAVGMVVYFFGDPEERSLAPVKPVVPLCLFAGVAFVVPFALTALFIGPELPSIIGSMVGITVTIAVLRAGYFVPEEEWTFPERDEWPDHWVGSVEPGGGNGTGSEATGGDSPSMSLARAWAPYLILVVLLIITRDFTPIGEVLSQAAVFTPEWDGILGTEVTNSIDWAYVPGTWLVLSALIAIPLFDLDGSEVAGAWREAGQKIVSPAIALVFVIGMVGIMLESGQYPDAPGGDSMMVVLADGTATVFGDIYTVVAVPIGVLGTFITGSITVSNITFSGLQYEVATQAGLPQHLIVGGQMIGAAIGNVIAIHNVIAALATVGLVGQEGRVIRLNLIPVLFYIIMGAIVISIAVMI
ncbi:L-lactate permease [Natranaeroarchaeum sulfidigenes]|uniref:L-lactate permease n=1 Tax=Natranaeroarchaeum sulfidigenes TaxID=2784880 RepID=A0A897MT79_9EURY|nr:L-lactate permease [Natranaeroarchaeum sulfidigenes]QSG03697.1 L-lactate permease [Natranaeroarchaeum sulfidigenes]